MSSSKHLLDSKSSGKAPEKNFVSTCNLLSQYVKEKGKLKDLSRSISGNLKATGKSDASQITKSAPMSTKNLLADLNQPPMAEGLTTPSGQMVSPNNLEEFTNIESTSKQATKTESKRAQMTILYDGKIWVFDDLAAEKADELMILARKGNNNGDLSTPAQKRTNLIGVLASNQEKRSLSNGNENIEEQVDADNNSDLPIARRSSLHRFLEKKKERASTRWTYQVDRDSLEFSLKEDEELELRL